MTDRELLELAARAAGVPAYWSVDGTIQNRPMFVVKAGGKMGTMPYESEWNPLKDDAEALRLAIECDMTVCTDGAATVSACSGYGHDKVMVTQTVSESGGDKRAATRRAIVLAAAEIGKKTGERV